MLAQQMVMLHPNDDMFVGQQKGLPHDIRRAP